MYSSTNSRNTFDYTQDGGWWEASEQKSSNLNNINYSYNQTCSNVYPVYPEYSEPYIFNDYQQSNFYYDCYNNIGLNNYSPTFYNMFDCQPSNDNVGVEFFPTITYGNAYSLLPSYTNIQLKPEIQEPTQMLSLNPLKSMSSSPHISSDTDAENNSNTSNSSQIPIEKSFVCKHCQRGFARNHDLNRHIKIHTNVRKFACEHCNKRFYRKDLWRRHSLTKKCNNIQISDSV